MSEILIEKLEQVLGEFRKLNGERLDGYRRSVDETGVKVEELREAVRKIVIPEEVKLRHEHLTTYEHQHINVWVKVMGWVTGVTIVAAISFCWYYKYTYDVNEENRRINASQKQTYDWLYNYFLYMRDRGAPKTTATYLKEHEPPQ